ncbi:Cullin binding-domain-containing protein [Pseudomassariella vexata]|uniref:Defective in cullin neddylation protein n=1 Tax=Pseudomassariella vexata TaxID=1141098 RepID=A0A1Y2DW03_9PEZI|nr:Cullin binding-domain-containing protein [Pseudomassariella vexata]ORY63472.1 Cullin binding-domain-containing protein [Pseudomassariella vexata]
MPLTSAQKTAVSQFVSITGVSEKVAQRYLKNASYKIDQAVDAFYSATGGATPSANREIALKNQFESLKTSSEDEAEKLGAESSMEYLQKLGVNLEDASLFVALEVIQAESIGEIKKSGFVEGWKAVGIDGTIPAQRNYIQTLVSSLRSNPEAFRKAYRYTFVVGKEADQRALSKENAILYWEMLFKPPGRPWVGKKTGINFLPEWTAFLNEKWTRSVNKDMWNQTLEFARKSMDDESFHFWSEDDSWPGVIDEFVEWYRSKHAGSMAMDVDA